MKIFTLLFLLSLSTFALAQSDAEILKQIENANDAQKALLYNQLAERNLTKEGAKVIKYGDEAYSYATKTGNKVAMAEAKNIQAKAYAGNYLGGAYVPWRDTKKKNFFKAERLFKESREIAANNGLTALEFENIEQLIFINSRRTAGHKPSPQNVEKYYAEYVDRLKSTKGITKPNLNAYGDLVGTPSTNNNSKPSNNGANNPSDSRELQRLQTENKNLKDRKEVLENEVAKLEKKLNIDKESSALSEEALRDFELREQELTDVIDQKEGEKRRLITKYKGERVYLINKYEQDSIERAVLLEKAQLRSSRYKQGIALGGIIAALVIGAILIGLLLQRRARKRLQETNIKVLKEQERSEELLLNILPANIAQELKVNGAARAKLHNNVSVLFSDFKNFTKIAEALSPDELVAELHYCFKGFDFIISQYPYIEKIKTIGDAYMCAAGLDAKDSREAEIAARQLVQASLEMQEFLEDYLAERKAEGKPAFEARIGIHTGPVVSGVVGTKKFAYDIWGDTVNTASRMESNGEIGKVNISNNTQQLINLYFKCNYRGKIAAKNKGTIDMFFVESSL